MAKPLRNVGASVRARLLMISRTRNQTFDLVLTRYVLERILYRLTQTPHRERFALKGALLVTTWFTDPHRPTRDVDFLGFGDADPDAVLAVFRDVCAVPMDDGVVIDLRTLRIDRIRDEQEYGGLRLRTVTSVGGALVTVKIDIGFGDSVTPGLEEIDLPVLLDFPAPRLRAYAPETVIAEKFQTMVRLGRANSRMKDFYDVWVLSRTYHFDGPRLPAAIAATFDRRNTALPVELPDALTPEFADDPAKRAQWRAFIADLMSQPGDLATVVSDLATFLMPHAGRARTAIRGPEEPPVARGERLLR
jgi:predicted nucleotidyltransferase component of viral defense system